VTGLAATIRPDSWNIALLVHLLGAMVLVGALVLAAAALLLAWRRGEPELTRLGYRAMLLGALPGWIVMRGGAEWISSKEDLSGVNVSWLDIGGYTADIGFLFILISTLLAGLAMRRASHSGGPSISGRLGAAIVSVLIAAYLVATWAMTTKPT
jgi:hypothetical protein